MDYTLELIVMPVSDIDRSKAFYSDRVGLNVDVDFSAGDDFRIVQMTPHGSACSITLMKEPDRAGKLKGLHLCVSDIEGARRELTERGLDVSQPFWFDQGRQQEGLHPERSTYGTFMSFEDPDGNSWLVQEVRRG
jgi:predicted enzyme related to lactoylglutathione lyase